MIELPESLTLARQLTESVSGRRVIRVSPPTKPHKFCWFAGDPSEYDKKLAGRSVTGAEGFGSFAELGFDDGQRLCVNDGVNLRLMDAAAAPRDRQLLIELDDGSALCLTVAMYGGVILHDGTYDNEYYIKGREAVSPFDPAFPELFHRRLSESKPALSMKAFVATEQRFPGVGNGTAQDILFAAGLNPKRKLSTVPESGRELLLERMVSVLREMTEAGGRDTEKDIYGVPGGYRTKMSRNALTGGCPVCGSPIVKEAYLGGSVYWCPVCQPL